MRQRLVRRRQVRRQERRTATSAGSDSECNSGTCSSGKCAGGKKGEGEECDSDEDCDSGKCTEGKCAAGGGRQRQVAEALDRDRRVSWTSTSCPAPTTCVCVNPKTGLAPGNSAGYSCVDPSTGTAFPPSRRSIWRGQPGRLRTRCVGGLKLGNFRLFLSARLRAQPERAPRRSRGLRHRNRSRQAPRFPPLHLEGRFTYLFGKNAVSKKGLLADGLRRPRCGRVRRVRARDRQACTCTSGSPKGWLLAEGTRRCTVTENAWITGGPVFFSVGGGVRALFSPKVAITRPSSSREHSVARPGSCRASRPSWVSSSASEKARPRARLTLHRSGLGRGLKRHGRAALTRAPAGACALRVPRRPHVHCAGGRARPRGVNGGVDVAGACLRSWARSVPS